MTTENITASKTSARIEVFRPGKFTSMEGAELTYSGDDLKAIATAYDSETAPAPVVIGHPSMDAPAFGWVDRFEYDEATERLSAVLKDLEPAFSDAVKAGRYRKVSLQFFHPHHPANPNPGTWYPKHIGFLGAAAPAVTGLKNVAFSIPPDEAITFEGDFASFGDPGFERSASLFRRLREFFIAEHGLEKADQALPGYEIEWLADIELIRDTGPGHPSSFAAPHKNPNDPKEAPVPGDTPAEIAARETALAAREQAIRDREMAIAHAQNVSFAEQLVTEGRLLPLSKAKVVAVLDALPTEATVSFAAGEAAISPAEAIRQVLAAQPKVVSFGALDLGAAPGEGSSPSFAADGKAVDPAQLEIHTKALAYQRQHPGTAYMAAVQAVS